MPRIIDLTLTIRPGLRGVEFEQLHSVKEHDCPPTLEAGDA
jgi:hypothetical protein